MKKLGCKAVTVTFSFLLFVGILFTVILGFNPGGWLQITTYALPPLLTLAGGAFIVASRWKIPFLILMAAASMAFNIPLQNWAFSFGR